MVCTMVKNQGIWRCEKLTINYNALDRVIPRAKRYAVRFRSWGAPNQKHGPRRLEVSVLEVLRLNRSDFCLKKVLGKVIISFSGMLFLISGLPAWAAG